MGSLAALLLMALAAPRYARGFVVPIEMNAESMMNGEQWMTMEPMISLLFPATDHQLKRNKQLGLDPGTQLTVMLNITLADACTLELEGGDSLPADTPHCDARAPDTATIEVLPPLE